MDVLPALRGRAAAPQELRVSGGRRGGSGARARPAADSLRSPESGGTTHCADVGVAVPGVDSVLSAAGSRLPV